MFDYYIYESIDVDLHCNENSKNITYNINYNKNYESRNKKK